MNQLPPFLMLENRPPEVVGEYAAWNYEDAIATIEAAIANWSDARTEKAYLQYKSVEHLLDQEKNITTVAVVGSDDVRLIPAHSKLTALQSELPNVLYYVNYVDPTDADEESEILDVLDEVRSSMHQRIYDEAEPPPTGIVTECYQAPPLIEMIRQKAGDIALVHVLNQAKRGVIGPDKPPFIVFQDVDIQWIAKDYYGCASRLMQDYPGVPAFGPITYMPFVEKPEDHDCAFNRYVRAVTMMRALVSKMVSPANLVLPAEFYASHDEWGEGERLMILAIKMKLAQRHPTPGLHAGVSARRELSNVLRRREGDGVCKSSFMTGRDPVRYMAYTEAVHLVRGVTEAEARHALDQLGRKFIDEFAAVPIGGLALMEAQRMIAEIYDSCFHELKSYGHS